MSQPNLLLLQIEPQAWNEVLFIPSTDHQWRLLAEFLDFSLLFRSFIKSTSHIFVWKFAFVLHHIKTFPKSTRCFFLIGWSWEDLLTCKKHRARVWTCQLVQYKRINNICPFCARTTKVFVFRGYLSRVKIIIFV